MHLLGKVLTTGGRQPRRFTTGPLIVMDFGIGSPSLVVSLDTKSVRVLVSHGISLPLQRPPLH